MRAEEGSFEVKEDRNGGRYFLHRLTAGTTRVSAVPAELIGIEPQRADPDTLNKIYAAFLARLKLSECHRKNLGLRGLTDEVIDRNGYKTLSTQGRARIAGDLHVRFGEKLLGVPGFVFKEGDRGRYITVRGPAGVIVPVRDLAGRIIALKARGDGQAANGPKYVY